MVVRQENDVFYDVTPALGTHNCQSSPLNEMFRISGEVKLYFPVIASAMYRSGSGDRPGVRHAGELDAIRVRRLKHIGWAVWVPANPLLLVFAGCDELVTQPVADVPVEPRKVLLVWQTATKCMWV